MNTDSKAVRNRATRPPGQHRVQPERGIYSASDSVEARKVSEVSMRNKFRAPTVAESAAALEEKPSLVGDFLQELWCRTVNLPFSDSQSFFIFLQEPLSHSRF